MYAAPAFFYSKVNAKIRLMESRKKIYCFVDETGQDAGSEVFIVVAVIVAESPNILRQQLIEIEKIAKIGKTKWHKLRNTDRTQFLSAVLKIRTAEFKLYFGQYKKNLFFFLPLVETIAKSIKDFAPKNRQAIICVDGIDRQKAGELTTALRDRGIKLKYVRTARDESEPLIRLADRWAGCIRLGIKGSKQFFDLMSLAVNKGLLKRL